MMAPVVRRHQPHICLSLLSPAMAPHRSSHPVLQLRLKRHGDLSGIQVRSQSHITVFSRHGSLGGAVGRWFWSKEPLHRCFPPSRRPAPQTACRGSGLRLPKEKVKRVQPERVHSKRHGWVWGESITTSHPLAEDKAWRYKPLVPTPTLAAAQTPGHALTGHRKQGCCTS